MNAVTWPVSLSEITLSKHETFKRDARSCAPKRRQPALQLAHLPPGSAGARYLEDQGGVPRAVGERDGCSVRAAILRSGQQPVLRDWCTELQRQPTLRFGTPGVAAKTPTAAHVAAKANEAGRSEPPLQPKHLRDRAGAGHRRSAEGWEGWEGEHPMCCMPLPCQPPAAAALLGLWRQTGGVVV